MSDKLKEIDRAVNNMSKFYDSTKRICGEKNFLIYRDVVQLLKEYRAVVEKDEPKRKIKSDIEHYNWCRRIDRLLNLVKWKHEKGMPCYDAEIAILKKSLEPKEKQPTTKERA